MTTPTLHEAAKLAVLPLESAKLLAREEARDALQNEINAAIEALREALAQQGEPVAWLYTLEYGKVVADTCVSLTQKNYPFGVCGADYLAKNNDGVSYVRQTPLFAIKPVQRHGLVELTDEQIMQIARESGLDLEPTRNFLIEVRGQHAQLVNMARAIERALGIGEKQ